LPISDGLDFEHHDPRRKAKTHYDEVWDALEESPIHMVGDHTLMGDKTFRLVDANTVKVGEIVFSNKMELLGATWYGEPLVSGRIKNKRSIKFDLLAKIEETYVKRR